MSDLISLYKSLVSNLEDQIEMLEEIIEIKDGIIARQDSIVNFVPIETSSSLGTCDHDYGEVLCNKCGSLKPL